MLTSAVVRWKLIYYQTCRFTLKYGPTSLRVKVPVVFTIANQSGNSEIMTICQITYVYDLQRRTQQYEI